MDDLLLCQPSKNNTDVLAGLSRKTTTDYDDSTTLYSQVRVYWVDRGAFMLTKLFCAFSIAIHRPAVTFWVKLETVQGLYFIISFVGLLSLKEGTCFTISKRVRSKNLGLDLCFVFQKTWRFHANYTAVYMLNWSDSPSQYLNLLVTFWPEQLSDWSHGSEVVWPCRPQSDLSCLTGLTFRSNR